MSDDLPIPAQAQEPAPAEHDHEHGHHGHKKHKDKVRSAWISFVGRIVAQIAGAGAAVVIGLAVVNEYGTKRADKTAPRDADAATATQAHRTAVSPDEIDLAVLPFESLATDPAHAYFADGVTEALIADLTRIEGLHVISRTSSMHYKGLRKSMPEIAADLNVDFIVEGTVGEDGGRVRVNAQLVDAIADHELWAQSYDRPKADVLALQTEIAAAIARELTSLIAPAVEGRLGGRARIAPFLYEQYVKGRRGATSRTVAGLQVAVNHFEQAILIDPRFAPAWAGLSSAYVQLGLSLAPEWNPERALALARSAAMSAVGLDPDLAEAHAVLAVVAHRLDWDWTASDARFRRAISLRPGDALARQWHAVFLAEQGRHREALAEAEFAVELDPFATDAHSTLGLVHYYAKRFSRAAQAARRALQFDPGFVPARLVLAWSLLEQGDTAGTISACEVRPWQIGLDQMLAALADANRRRGNSGRAAQIGGELMTLDSPSPCALLRWHISRGETNEAFRVLEHAVDKRSDCVRALRVDPLFAPLRRDLRFAAVLSRIAPE